jgi:hypothetical protein
MPPPTETMIGQIRSQCEELVTYVTGPAGRDQTAGEVERALLRQLLQLGALLLRLFFASRAAERPAPPASEPGRGPWRYHDRRERAYFSIFGKVAVERHAFVAAERPVRCPLDAELSLPGRCYSDLLREWMAYGATEAAYREAATTLERVLGLRLSTQALETTVAEAAGDVAAFYEQPPDLSACTAADAVLVAQADGKGVPLIPPAPGARPVRCGKGQRACPTREAVVTGLYRVAPYVRTPEQVAAALLRDPAAEEPAAGRPRPAAKELRATLTGKPAALARLAARAAQWDGPDVRDRVALTDGDDGLQRLVRQHLPDYPLVLDIIHAVEYLWDAATALLGERHPKRTAWVRRQLLRLLSGQVGEVIRRLERLAAHPGRRATQRQALQRTIGYYRRNAAHMRYDAYLAAGWPIGTGVIESACGHLVKARCDQAGMRWTQPGAEALLDLRAVRLNGDWDRYWDWHRHRQHQSRYGPSDQPAAPPEQQLAQVA